MEIFFNPERKSSGFKNTCGRDLKPDSRERRKHNDYSNQSCVSLAYISLRETKLEWWIHAILESGKHELVFRNGFLWLLLDKLPNKTIS